MKNENALIWGFCGEDGKEIVNNLRASLNIVDWYSDQQDSINILSVLQGTFFNQNIPLTHLDKFSDFLREYFFTYSAMITRRGLKFSDFHELINEFSISYHYFCNLILKKNVQLVIFANLPHEGPDYVLYQVAKMLNLKTLMCYQSIFPNQFFMTTSMDDFGSFHTVPKMISSQNFPLEPGFKQKVSYMLDIEKRQHVNAEGGMRLIIYRLGEAAKKAYFFLIRIIRLFLNPQRINLPNLAGKIKTFHLESVYKKNSISILISENKLNELIDSDRNIVYFPLHLQPELTTSAIGGIFQDQLLAIETLRTLLPDDWIILVKENPKQGHFQRGDLFFKRLSNLSKIYWVDRYFPSDKILEKAYLTAVIAGTAGWEAIKGGSKCIVFGQAWYSSLPGCFKYQEGTAKSDITKFLSSKYSFLQMKNMLGDLLKKSGTGVVDPGYKSLVEGYTLDGNADQVVQSLMCVIKDSKTIW
jgi:hypothetical protein